MMMKLLQLREQYIREMIIIITVWRNEVKFVQLLPVLTNFEVEYFEIS